MVADRAVVAVAAAVRERALFQRHEVDFEGV